MGGGLGRSGTPSIYSQYQNFPQNIFPVTAWLQNPEAAIAGFDNLAEAMRDCGINIMMGLDDTGSPWPTAFGEDSGQMEAIHAAELYLVAYGQNLGLDTSGNVSRNSVASFKALDVAHGGGRTLVGYNDGDEPQCGAPTNAVPGKAATISGFDSTRPYICNLLPVSFNAPLFSGCLDATMAALRATGAGSFDSYVFTSPYNVAGDSNFISRPQDSLYQKGLCMQTMRYYARPGQPLWTFVAGGNDAFGQAGEANSFTGSIENGSDVLTNASGFSVFTSSWLSPLKYNGTGIPTDATFLEILSPTTARMSGNATATNAAVSVTVTGGDLTCCRADQNICVVRGNRFRATPAEVAADVWICVINGANGIQWFPQDSTALAYSFGGGGSAGALAAAANLKHVNGVLQALAPMLNSTTVGICSMDAMDPVTGFGVSTVSSSCSNGILTMATSDIAVPGAALAKSFGGKTYLLAQPSRRGSAAMTFTLSGRGGKTARVLYDTNSRYDSPHSEIDDEHALNGSGQFTDTFGANGNHYQTKIYEIS